MQYIESTVEDIEAAFGLMKPVLFSKSDELTRACRNFLEELKSRVEPGGVFYTQQIRRQLRVSSSTVHRYVRQLKAGGYIKYRGGSRFRGYEYQVTDYEEYNRLKSEVDAKLESILKKVKALSVSRKCIPVSQRYPSGENGISKSKTINTLS